LNRIGFVGGTEDETVAKVYGEALLPCRCPMAHSEVVLCAAAIYCCTRLADHVIEWPARVPDVPP